MADETPQLDEARLAEIRRRIDVLIPGQVMTEYDITMLSLLSAEVDRLRAKEATMRQLTHEFAEVLSGATIIGPSYETLLAIHKARAFLAEGEGQ